VARHQQISEENLIKLLSSKNPLGMEILYDNYSGVLYGVLYRIVQHDEIAEELLQDVFLKIWNQFRQYDASRGRLYTWMLNIARNQAIDKIRSREFINSTKNQSLDDSVNMPDISHSSFNPETIGLKEAVSKLEPEYSEIIDLMYFKGLTQIEVALKLHLPLGTVKTRSRTAVMKLRNYFSSMPA
jgi:RNA polymerase sigma-70 factor (ECF subfamily)